MGGVVIPSEISQRGSGRPIDRKLAIVYDHMPLILADQFRTDDILSKRLFCKPPIDQDWIIAEDAYTRLGDHYLRENRVVPALECYKHALYQRADWVLMKASIQETTPLDESDLPRLEIKNDLETRLIRSLSTVTFDQETTLEWIDELREKYFSYEELPYDAPERIHRALELGRYDKALIIAKERQDTKLISELQAARPREILDLKLLNKFMYDSVVRNQE